MIQEFQNVFVNLSSAQWTVLVAFLVIFSIRFVYLFMFTARVAFKKKKARNGNGIEPIALILTVRNAEENIQKNLPSILQIEDLDFEVVAIDDFSQDNTLSVLGLLKQRFPRLKISTLSQETRFSVKMAQNIAFKLAAHNWVLCVPIALSEVNEAWLHCFADCTGISQTNVVLGYSTVSPQNGFFNLLYRIEIFFQQIQSVGYILNGIPFVCNEENVAFKKEKYYELGGYAKNLKEPYANLELIINTFIKRKNTLINFNADSVIRKNTKIDGSVYLDLLKKSARIENYLSFGKKQALLFDELTKLLFLPLLLACLVFCFALWPLISILVGIFILAQVLIIKIVLNRLNERKIFIPSLVYGLIMPYYKLFFRWHFSKTSRKHQWRKMF